MALKIEKGWVNEHFEPCVFIEFQSGKKVEFLVDTGFNGSLCVPSDFVEILDLKIISEVEMFGVGNHREIVLMAVAEIFWFGEKIEIEVLINEGDDRLLGSELLSEKILTINYAKKLLTIK